MQQIEVRNMTQADEAYVAGSTVEGGIEALDDAGRTRLNRFKSLAGKGLRVKVALLDGAHAGSACVLPIELCPWCATGRDLMALPCLYVHHQPESHGVGRALLEAAEQEAREQDRKGMVIVAFRDDFWPVEPSYFKEVGYRVAGHHGRRVVLWKPYAEDVEKPEPVKRRYKFERVRGKVVIDLFYNTICRPSVIEARRVRELAAKFGGSVLLREYCADEHEVLLEHGIPRAIFINGREQNWGYAAPAKALSEEIGKEIVWAEME